MKTDSLTVAIVGAGIGGLTAALALRQLGAKVRVFERAPEIKEVGAGLGVWANAVRVLDILGVGDRLRTAAQPMKTVGLYSANGRPLSITDMTAFTHTIGTPSFVMHRADLQGALLKAVGSESLETNRECVGLGEFSNKPVVYFASRSDFKADLVIGADGFNSIVRTSLWGDSRICYSGQSCYRGIVRIPIAQPGLLAEIQGPGKRLGYCPFAQDRLYWFACHNAPRNQPEDSRGAKAKLLEMFRGWPFDLPNAIQATPDDAIIRNDLNDRTPLKRWSRGSVTLLGDAAHPMLPNLGQGACTAIEDAAVLARSLQTESDLAAALARYEAERIPRTTRLVNLSRRFGHLARWKNPLLVSFRETVLRLTPDSVMQKEFLSQLDYETGVGLLAKDGA
jgi:2-polyprenyl-6-methoxyphenol hydroxylase-like FAD-dependent oxidoreductase